MPLHQFLPIPRHSRLLIFSGVSRLIANHPTSPSSKAHQKPGSFPPPALPGFNSTMTLSDTRPMPPLVCGVEAATSDPDGSPSITRITLPTCCVQYPGRPNRCICRLLPCPRGLPRAKDGSASASTLSRPARTSLTLRPVGSLDRPRRPLSRGFNQTGCPAELLVSFRINRQLSGWNLPPQMIRAVEAHSCPHRSRTDRSESPLFRALHA